MRLLALLLVQPHPTPRFHQRRLCRCVRGLSAVMQGGVLRVCEPVGSVFLQSRELPYQAGEARACGAARFTRGRSPAPWRTLPRYHRPAREPSRLSLPLITDSGRGSGSSPGCGRGPRGASCSCRGYRLGSRPAKRASTTASNRTTPPHRSCDSTRSHS
jgi:hypothetical protein